MLEYEHIVEFSYLPKQQKFVVRFLDGKTCVLQIVDLPKKMQTKKPQWEDAYLSPDHKSILVKAGKEARHILAHMIHARGKEL